MAVREGCAQDLSPWFVDGHLLPMSVHITIPLWVFVSKFHLFIRLAVTLDRSSTLPIYYKASLCFRETDYGPKCLNSCGQGHKPHLEPKSPTSKPPFQVQHWSTGCLGSQILSLVMAQAQLWQPHSLVSQTITITLCDLFDFLKQLEMPQ